MVPNAEGRVLESAGGAPVRGLYTAGWIKRGPSGLIGTNKADAFETVNAMLADFEGSSGEASPEWDAALKKFLLERVPALFQGADWRALDAVEVAAGDAVGKPREKVTSVSGMLDAVRS